MMAHVNKIEADLKEMKKRFIVEHGDLGRTLVDRFTFNEAVNALKCYQGLWCCPSTFADCYFREHYLTDAGHKYGADYIDLKLFTDDLFAKQFYWLPGPENSYYIFSFDEPKGEITCI